MPPVDIILSSASPRRRELLSLILSDYRVIVSDFDESLAPSDLTPDEHVLFCAEAKAREVASRHADSLIIGADTIVVVDREILGKPESERDAARMLRCLGGRIHEVYSGIVVKCGDTELREVECTQVQFRELSEDCIAKYIATGEPMDKAGAYAIQGKGAILIKGISGCYSNVVGLPLYTLSTMLSHFEVELICG
ncbi:MAG: septum formation inhibitor Maf [Armatimonadetes bacterium]|nr:septum formation inhibitor Maf [Armatimonadota bacterium]